MGDRYTIGITCIYCNTKNRKVWYAPTCGSDTFICKQCKKENFITQYFKAKKLKDVEYSDIKDGFLIATNVDWSDKIVWSICMSRLRELKKGGIKKCKQKRE